MWKHFWDWFAALPQGSASFLGTLTGSTLGLLALLVGALFNAHLNRRRDDRLRVADRFALASTLHAELLGIHGILVDNARHLTDKPPDADGGFLVPEPSIKLLPEVLSKIGLLDSDTIQKVMKAYALTEQYLDRLILIGGTLRSDMLANRQFVYLDAQHAKVVIEFNGIRARAVKEAVDALAPYLK
jgi:hypothetical protein